MNRLVYAHSTSRPDRSDWEPLDTHLFNVADQAAAFAAAFDAAEFGRLAGLWHDLGKFLPEFQRRLQGDTNRVDHAGPGTAAAMTHGLNGLPLAFVIAGHHTGLANLHAKSETSQTPLHERAKQSTAAWEQIRSNIPSDFWPHTVPNLPVQDRRSLELWTRMLLSALVDADYLETERFYEPARTDRRGQYDPLAKLKQRLDAYVEKFAADTPVNRIRAQVLGNCRHAATQPPGLFSLTVPTGGGKTLSGLAFALDHAAHFGLRRVVVAIPYTSIIEQTADVYRKVFGDVNVIEHHSNVDTQQRELRNGDLEDRRRLAAENWDAPIIVTTNVQLLESLLANRPSQCRKLHNLARSVIVLDEAQCLPLDVASTIVELLGELATRFHSTVVLSTATQPAFKERERFPQGLKNVPQIVADPESLAVSLKRVKVRWPTDPQVVPDDYTEIAREIAARPRVLAIVHKRVDARTLAKSLPDEGLYHLSALMCPAHRRRVLKEVRGRLKLDDGRPLRLVATQLIEAGVDVDFPVVYRALAGLDSLAQAAGRCDREGRLTAMQGSAAGEVVIFRAPTDPPRGTLLQGLQTTLGLIDEQNGELDLSDPALLEKYFRRLYFKTTERAGLQAARNELAFATVDKLSKLIEDHSQPLVVPYRDNDVDAKDAIATFRHEMNQQTLRGLQPFLVQIHDIDRQRLYALGGIERVHERMDVLTPLGAHLYDSDLFGLVVDDESQNDPAALIA